MYKKVAIIPGRFSQIWLLTKHEIQIFTHPFVFFDYLPVKPSTEIWRFVAIFSPTSGY
jgi:hypothetical protein